METLANNRNQTVEEVKDSPDYNWFRSTVPLKRIIVDDDDSKVWSLYDAGPKSIRCPIMFLPPVSGTAEVFFQQMLALTGWGYRVISLQYPVYWDLMEFCDGFRKLLDHLQLDKVRHCVQSLFPSFPNLPTITDSRGLWAVYKQPTGRFGFYIYIRRHLLLQWKSTTQPSSSLWMSDVHLFGASLGGFLAQKFAEFTCKSPRVQSLILCNSFSDTSIFNQTWTANSFWLMPAFMLKKIVLGNFAKGPVDPEMAGAIDFMVDRVFDQSALSLEAKEEMYKLFPNAKRAHLKTGGNFPYLCRSADVNLYIQHCLNLCIEFTECHMIPLESSSTSPCQHQGVGGYSTPPPSV
ncbi:maspardin isoform X3 [Festucalex cinctus]